MKFVRNFAFAFLAAATLAVCADGAESQTAQTLGVHVGSNYGGGIVFYVDGLGHGLIAATSDLPKETGPSIPNDVGPWNRAVQASRDYRGGGYTDWFMPSKDQLAMMWLQRRFLNLSNFCYWSSTEDDPATATADGIVHNVWIECYDGPGAFKGKSNTFNDLRPIRAF